MSKKKEKAQQSSSESPNKPYIPFFSPDFKADLRWRYQKNPKTGDKIMDLIADILTENPFSGIGKPEPLKYMLSNTWSRRITQEHRLVYRVVDNNIYFLQARYHYEKD
ncbi:MAG: Txe/YoeB family addiction module toxin [Xenococcus sp. (in: cyanobacteria)]